MKISILIPTYNSSNFIHKTIYHTVAQLKKINVYSEIIIVDDFSTDNTYAKLNYIKKKFQSRKINIKPFLNNKNFGQYQNTILALKKSVGEFIVTIDDDYSFSNKFIIELFESIKNNSSDIVFGIMSNKSLFDKLGRKLITTLSEKNFSQSSSCRIFSAKLKKQILKKHNKYNNFHSLIFNNFNKISSINFKNSFVYNQPRISNYTFFDKIEIFFSVIEKRLSKYFSCVFLLIITCLAGIFVFSSYRLFMYFLLNQPILPGWTSVILIGFVNMFLNLIVILITFRFLIKFRQNN